ncbi:class I SAM-dependent methyltransferase [Fodinicola feengrottensis]|uniref:Class I SAM-dependent methyltransferase n=1 Tax=Fodinicola feengrottensis TaxID=435914 RepID=A0ABN2G2Q5_9ACTN|nr:class I SAM-dependent methyltransferase [Fodinicola feengrottensis]
MANAEQAVKWNGESGQFWAAHDDRYDAMLRPLTARLLSAAHLVPTDRVLDVGCGCGATTRIAATLAGQVLGVDLSEPMLARARERAADRDNVRFEAADVQSYDFGAGAYDAVISQLGVMFFDDRETAFGNLRRALRPGGRLAFVCWQDENRNEHRTVQLAALAPYVQRQAEQPADAPGPFTLADPEVVRTLLANTGFVDVTMAALTEPLPVGTDAADAAEFVQHIPSNRAALADLPEETLAEFGAALRDRLLAYETPQGVLLRSAAWLVTARAADQ